MAIHIKKSHRGLLHKNLGVAKGKKIPASKLTIHKGDSPALKKRKQFAINAKKWKHQDGGVGPTLPAPYAPPITYTQQNPNLNTPLNLYNSRMNAQGAQYLLNNVKYGPKGPYLNRQDYHQTMNIARGEKIPQFPTEPTSQSKLPMYLNPNEIHRADSTVSANRALQYSTPSLGYTDAMKVLRGNLATKPGYEVGGIHLSPESIPGYQPGDATVTRLNKGFQQGGVLPTKPLKRESLVQLQGSQRGYNIHTDFKAGRVSPKVYAAYKRKKKLQDGGYTDANAVSAKLMQANTYPVKPKKNKYLKKNFQMGGQVGNGQWGAGSSNASGVGALGSVAGSAVSGIGADKYGVTSTGAAIGGGALSGAAMGLTVGGPWGALIGGVIGGAVGGIKNKMAKDKRTKALEGIARAQNVQNANQSETVLANYDNMGTGVKSFAAGGTHPHGGLHPTIPMKLVNGKWLVSAPGGYGNDGNYHFTDRSFLVERDQNNKKLKAYQQGGLFDFGVEGVDAKRAKVNALIAQGQNTGYGGNDWARAQGFQNGGVNVNGGDLQPISDNAYEVKGDNPQATDDVQYQDAYVDHGEVLKPGAGGTQIFSDHLKVPGTGRTFAKEAKKLEKSKSIKGNPNPNQDALIESKLKALFHTQQRLNDDSQGESTEEAIQPTGEIPGRGMSEGNMFRMGGLSPGNVTYHDINPARIGSLAKEAMATGVMSKKYYNAGGEAVKLFQTGGALVPANFGITRKSKELAFPYPTVEARRATYTGLPSDTMKPGEAQRRLDAMKPSYNCGGMRKHFALGGKHYDPISQTWVADNDYAIEKKDFDALPGQFTPSGQANQFLIKNQRFGEVPAANTAGKAKSNVNWSGLAGLGASLAGNVSNAMALRNMPDVAEVSLTKAPKLKKLDYSDQKAMLREGLNTSLKAGARNSTMRQAQEGSQAASLSEYSRAVNQMHGDVNRTNAQISNEEAQLGWRNNLMNNQISNQYRQDQQSRLSAMMSAQSANLADVGNKVQGYVAQNNAMKLDQQKLNMNLAQLEITAPGAGYRHLIANGYTPEQAQQMMAQVSTVMSGQASPQRVKYGGFVPTKKPLSYRMGGSWAGGLRRIR